MDQRSLPVERRTAPRLYLMTSPDPAALGDLGPILEAADVAAVLLRLPAADERSLIKHVKAVAPIVQGKGAALLLDGHPEIIARAGADGAHLTGIAALNTATADLKPQHIAGAGGLTTRHDAMLAGEAGADYVMFGERDQTGHRPAFNAILERVAWWAEVFEVPCVGFAETLDEVSALGEAGADFVAVGDLIFADRQPIAMTKNVWERLRLRVSKT